MSASPYLRISGRALAREIREGRATSAGVVDAHIAHIEAINPALNALVADRFDLARQEARAADQRLKAEGPEGLPPLHGVPCTIKEAFFLKGMPNTSGLVSRKGTVCAEDGPTVARLRAAGAIPLGSTNLSELCMWFESHNNVYGRCRNPYDPRRMAGGSSGGEGAIIGGGGSPFGLGADIGGSIRMPAFFNGVFGHKATPGRIPNEGQYPIAEGSAIPMLASGPLARRGEDLSLLVDILSGGPPMPDPKEVDLKGLRIVSVRGNGLLPVAKALRDAQTAAEGALRARGAKVEVQRVPYMGRTLELWSTLLSSEDQTSYKVLLGGGVPVRPFMELMKFCVGRSPFTLPSIMLALSEDVAKISPTYRDKVLALGEVWKQEMAALLGEDGLLLFPSHPWRALFHRLPLLMPHAFSFTAAFNALLLPVTQVPLGLGSKALPLGVQVVAPPGQDSRAIACALALEEAFGGWAPPPRIFGSAP